MPARAPARYTSAGFSRDRSLVRVADTSVRYGERSDLVDSAADTSVRYGEQRSDLVDSAAITSGGA